MKTTVSLLLLSVLLSSCAHVSEVPQTEFTPPWRVVADGVAALVAQHANHSDFDRFRESSVPPEQLHTFTAVERLTGTQSREFTADERTRQRQWFHSSASVWHYTFESQFSAILFFDPSGRVQHAILLG